MKSFEGTSIDCSPNHDGSAWPRPAWRDRLASQGVTHVWGVHVRALREGSAGIVRIDATDDVRACDATLSRWD